MTSGPPLRSQSAGVLASSARTPGKIIVEGDQVRQIVCAGPILASVSEI